MARTQAILVRHSEVQEQDVWFEFVEQLDRFVPVTSFPDDGNITGALEQLPQTLPEDGVVVRDHHTNIRIGLHFSHGAAVLRQKCRTLSPPFQYDLPRMTRDGYPAPKCP
jgi:hypothetical protein